MNPSYRHLAELNLATILLSTSGVLGKLISMDATYTIFLRSVLALVFLFAIIRLRRGNIKVDFRRDARFFLLSGALLGFHWASYFYAVQISSVAVAFISLFTFPVITTLLEPLFFKTKLSKLNLLGAALVLIGVYFLVPKFDLGNAAAAGALVGLGSAVLFALRNLMNKQYIGKYGSSTIMVYQLLVSIAVLSPVLFWADLSISPRNLGFLVLLSLFTTALGQTLFVNSLKHFSTSTASIITSLQPIYGITWAVLILGETLQPGTLIGGALILSTVFLENLRQFLARKKAFPQ